MDTRSSLDGNKKQAGKALLAGAVFAVMALILAFAIEIIFRNSFMDAWNWFLKSPQIFFTNFILVFLFMLLLYSVSGCIYISSSISYFVLLVLSLASYYKEKFLGDPIFPWDLMLKKEGMNIFPLLKQETGFVILIVIILASISIILFRFFLPRLNTKVYYRIIIGLIAFSVLFTVSFIKPERVQCFLSNAGMGEMNWKQDESYKRNGIILSFLRNIKNIAISVPQNYSKKNVLAVVNEIDFTEPNKSGEVKNPNIIFVMSEAFWDPTLISSVSFSSDPIPTFRKLQKEYTSGYVLSPQYGGLTANVEFEVLTGNSTSFLPSGSVPYQQFINEPVLSLASVLKEQGYFAAAVHSYLGWFWNRNTVYKYMGFDTFISSECMRKAKRKGGYIADSEVTKEIINQIKGSKQPAFIYAVTMQNHGPYHLKRYDLTEIKVKGEISEKSKNILETYAQGLKDADVALKTLIDSVYDSGEPTMIVFFGDHLPSLGDDYSVYTETGFISSSKHSEWTLDEYKKMRSVPIVIWSNFKQEKQTIKNMSDSFLGVYVLKMAGKGIPSYFRYVDKVYNILPGFLKELKIDSKGELHPGDDKDYKKLTDEYWLIEYDRLFGKKIQNNME